MSCTCTYTGLNRNAFDILLKFLEPVVPSYGNSVRIIILLPCPRVTFCYAKFCKMLTVSIKRLHLRHEYDVIITSVWQKPFRRTIDSREQGLATQATPPVLVYYFILCLLVMHPG